MGNQDAILTEYDGKAGLYNDYTSRCQELVSQLLEAASLRVHSVSSRVKTREKLVEKISRPGKDYTRLAEVTDVAGVRIITHFDDEVDAIGKLIRDEFSIDLENSIDKRKILDPDRFGYLSLHYVCSLSGNRAALKENLRFAKLPCEIQVRSILQHAWAEIEHDLGYKTGFAIPDVIRRRFSRLAGLLEIADQEFRTIRAELDTYSKSVPREIKVAPETVKLDDISVEAFIRTDKVVEELDAKVASDTGLSLVWPSTFQPAVGVLRAAGIATIEQLQKSLRDRSGDTLRVAT